MTRRKVCAPQNHPYNCRLMITQSRVQVRKQLTDAILPILYVAINISIPTITETAPEITPNLDSQIEDTIILKSEKIFNTIDRILTSTTILFASFSPVVSFLITSKKLINYPLFLRGS